MQTYTHELGGFLSTVKEEASEAFHIQEKAFKSQLGEISEGIDAALPEKVKEDASNIFKYIGGMIFETDDEEEPTIMKTEAMDVIFDSAFLTIDHTIDIKWHDFKELATPQMLELHKKTILSNDQNLMNLYQETVPSFISEEMFWEKWSYHNFLKKNPKKMAPSPHPEKGSDWGTWDVEEASVLSVSKETSQEPLEANGEGWDEWN